MSSTMCLRAAVHQLSSTPTQELPFIATYLASAISDCGAVLSTLESQKSSAGGQDSSGLVQKLKTRITSLLQDRTVEGRWTAVVLVKSIVEAGQWEILRGCEPWVRGLLGILNKPDPSSMKELCLITLTRIFLLTHRYQTLLREITTPTLPSFVTTCLNLISSKSAPQEARKLKPNTTILEPVLCSFIKLLPNHPTIFRPFSAQIHDLVLPLVGSIQAAGSASDYTIELAQQLFISLHHCAPKNTSGEEWLKACRSTILSLHRTGNHLFRAISEQWEPADPNVSDIPSGQDSGEQLGDDGADALGLPPWTGVHDGSAKMSSLLNLLSKFVLAPTNSTVALPLGSILDLTSRLTSLTVPPPDIDVSNIINPEIERNERESLWSEFPGIHVATLDLLRAITETLDNGCVSITKSCLDQALWIMESESFSRPVRTAIYRLVTAALPVIGFNLSKSDISSLIPALRASCRDLQGLTLDDKPEQPQRKNKSKPQSAAANADAFLNLQPKSSTDKTDSVTADSTGAAASELLYTFLSCVPVEFIPATLRADIDRTSILLQHKQTMMASVLHPVPMNGKERGRASIMPFLARSNPSDIDVEGLLRPRMPVLMNGGVKVALGSRAYEDETDPDDSMYPAINQSGAVEPMSAAQDIAPSVDALEAEKADNIKNRAEIGSKRSYEAELKSADEHVWTGMASGKRARTESYQLSDTKDVGLSQGLKELPILRPSAADLQEPVETIQPPVNVPLETSPIRPTAATAEDQVRSELETTGASLTRPSHAGMTDEESDEEIPTLNVEPDTDDEDEDEDEDAMAE